MARGFGAAGRRLQSREGLGRVTEPQRRETEEQVALEARRLSRARVERCPQARPPARGRCRGGWLEPAGPCHPALPGPRRRALGRRFHGGGRGRFLRPQPATLQRRQEQQHDGQDHQADHRDAGAFPSGNSASRLHHAPRAAPLSRPPLDSWELSIRPLPPGRAGLAPGGKGRRAPRESQGPGFARNNPSDAGRPEAIDGSEGFADSAETERRRGLGCPLGQDMPSTEASPSARVAISSSLK
jgi:hypothetical protein